MSEELSEYLQIHMASNGLNQLEIDSIASVATLRNYAAGEIVLHAGERVPAVALIINGLFSMSISEDPAMAFGWLRPNDAIGILSLVQDCPSSIYVVAAEASTVIEIESEAAQDLLENYKIFARNLLTNSNAHMTQMAIDGGKSNHPHRIAFIHVHSSTQNISKQIQLRLCEIGESVGRIINEQSTTTRNSLAHCETLKLDNNKNCDQGHIIREQLAKWTTFDRIVFDIDFEITKAGTISVEALRGLLSFPERVFVLVTPETATSAIGPLREVLANNSTWLKKLNLIWILNDDHHVAPLMPELTSLFHRDFKIKIPSTPSTKSAFYQRTSKPGIERVVHNLRGVQLGIALGGGAARGMSHLGVLKAMDESGIVIDAIAGTSVGAMMGVSYCVGYSPDNGVERFTNTLTPEGIFRLLGDKWYMLYKYRTKSWNTMLRQHFFDWHLEQMLVPLTTIAVDLISAEQFIRVSGDGVLGILESINLGGIATPICRDGMALVDGGYLNNVPADTLVRNGASFVMTVDVTKTISKRLGKNSPNTPTEKMIVPRINQVLSRIKEITQNNSSLMGGTHADFTIAPDVSQVGFADFKSTPKIANIGYQAGLEAIPALKEKLYQIDPQLFPIKNVETAQIAKDHSRFDHSLRRAG